MADLIISKSKLGKAVFANRDFKKGEKITEFIGKKYTYKQLPVPYDSVEDRYVQVGKNLYLGASGTFDDFINHSCNPNSGFKIKNKKYLLVAIKYIRKGDEITWDYSTTMDEDDWKMKCLCRNKNCRKRIRDFKYLPKKVRQKYIKLGIVPRYIMQGLADK